MLTLLCTVLKSMTSSSPTDRLGLHGAKKRDSLKALLFLVPVLKICCESKLKPENVMSLPQRSLSTHHSV